MTQPLLDQADTSLDFVALKENLKPIHVERINRDFLLCYSDFSFFVDRHGWRAFPEWKITWEGTPTSFAIFQPYILAFEPSFIEIRNMDTGSLVYILTAKNVRMLHSSTREVCNCVSSVFGLPMRLLTCSRTDSLCLRRRAGRGCYCEPGLLGGTAPVMNACMIKGHDGS